MKIIYTFTSIFGDFYNFVILFNHFKALFLYNSKALKNKYKIHTGCRKAGSWVNHILRSEEPKKTVCNGIMKAGVRETRVMMGTWPWEGLSAASCSCK